jgi:hypothetical protein
MDEPWTDDQVFADSLPLASGVLFLDEIYLEDIAAVRAVTKFEARRPDACVATDELAIVHRQAMRIGRPFYKFCRFQ